MKKLLFMSAAAFCMCTLSVTFTSCGNDDEKPAPEPAPPTPQYQTVSFEGNYFTALIDNPQNNGPQLYPSNPEAPLYLGPTRLLLSAAPSQALMATISTGEAV